MAGGGVEVLTGTVTGTLRMNADAVIYGKKVKRLLFDGSEAYPLELERKGLLPKGKG